jgi:hypothetical protein
MNPGHAAALALSVGLSGCGSRLWLEWSFWDWFGPSSSSTVTTRNMMSDLVRGRNEGGFGRFRQSRRCSSRGGHVAAMPRRRAYGRRQHRKQPRYSEQSLVTRVHNVRCQGQRCCAGSVPRYISLCLPRRIGANNEVGEKGAREWLRGSVNV